ncbi:MAG: hypothetical protein WC449_05550 [Candidatus Paceibacterota bacterium]
MVDWNETVEVELNGQAQKVNLGELKAGYLRQSDYTKKTQELADEKSNMKALQDRVTELEGVNADWDNYFQTKIAPLDLAGYEEYKKTLANNKPPEPVAPKPKENAMNDQDILKLQQQIADLTTKLTGYTTKTDEAIKAAQEAGQRAASAETKLDKWTRYNAALATLKESHGKNNPSVPFDEDAVMASLEKAGKTDFQLSDFQLAYNETHESKNVDARAEKLAQEKFAAMQQAKVEGLATSSIFAPPKLGAEVPKTVEEGRDVAKKMLAGS